MADFHGHPVNDHGEGGNGYKDAEVLVCPGCGKEYTLKPAYYRHVADCTGVYDG